MKWLSRYVWKRVFIVSMIAAAISISISTGVRWIIGAEADTVTIVVRLTLPFLIAIPLALFWFTNLERLDLSYRALLKETGDLSRRASTDPLTGLLNRRSFTEQFDAAMAHGIKGVFLIADMDYLKAINDKHGHLIGDDAIVSVAHALQEILGQGSLIARIGGDEFCAFIEWQNAADIERLVAKINETATEEFCRRTGDTTLVLSVSCAAAPCKRGDTFRSMVARTDSSLYSKKRSRVAAPELVN